MRIKDFTTKIGSGVTPRGGAEVYQDHGIPLFRSQNVTNDGFLLDDIAYISEEIDESMSGTRIKPNDVLLNITGASIGRCYYTPKDFVQGNVNQHVCIIRPTKKVIAPYLYYNLISDNGQRQIDLTQTGSNREGLTKENISNFEFELPDLDTQQRIVTYLDSHVASIDKRVSLLTSKRDHYLRLKTAIINRAVTQGLNPDVKMKDSGVEWIGMIPEHWKIKRIKEVVHSIKSGGTPSSKNQNFYAEKGTPWVSIGDMSFGGVIYDTENKVTELGIRDKNLQIIPQGTILYSIYASIGKVAELGVPATINQAILALDFNSRIDRHYVKFLLQSMEDYAFKISNGNTQFNLNLAKVRDFQLRVPPIQEQQSIASYLDEKCAKIDAIVDNLDKQIEKHKLLKRALINEVITGKRAV